MKKLKFLRVSVIRNWRILYMYIFFLYVINYNSFSSLSERWLAAMAATKFSHPFINGLKPLPEGYEEEIQQIREW